VTLYGGGGGALANRRRLFVVLAATHFRQYAGLLAGALEAAQGDVKGLVFLDLELPVRA
jgi:hypothetical protein